MHPLVVLVLSYSIVFDHINLSEARKPRETVNSAGGVGFSIHVSIHTHTGGPHLCECSNKMVYVTFKKSAVILHNFLMSF